MSTDENGDGGGGVGGGAGADTRMVGYGLRVRVYFGESDRHDHKALWLAFLEYLKANGAAGATVLRGIGGYGAHSRIHTAQLFEWSGDLPLILEWIDTEERVQRLLPGLTALLDGGLITTDPVEIVRYVPHERRGSRGGG